MFSDSVKAKGSLRVVLLDEQMKQKDQRDINNLVVAVGKEVIAARLIGNTLPTFSHMAIGNSNTAALASQTTLGSELGRVTLSSSTRTANTIGYAATFPAGTGTGVITEAGVFNAGTSGNMLCRTNFNAVNKAAGDTIIISWNVTIN